MAVVLAGLPSTAPLPEPPPGEAAETPAGGAASEARPFATRVVLGLATVDVVSSFAFGGVAVLTVVLAANVYGAGEAGTGGLNAAIGVGGILGAIVAGALVLRPGLGPVLVAGGLVTAAGVAILGLTEAFAIALVALLIASTGASSSRSSGPRSSSAPSPTPSAAGRSAQWQPRPCCRMRSARSSCRSSPTASVLAPVLVGSAVAVALTTVVAVALLGGRAAEPAAPDAALVARLSALPVFAGVSPAALDLGRDAPPTSDGRRGGAGRSRQGDVADRFYIGESGLYRVTQGGPGGERFVRDLPAPTAFGEIGLLRGSPRTASVTALSPGRLLELDGADFLRLVGSDAGLGPGCSTSIGVAPQSRRRQRRCRPADNVAVGRWIDASERWQVGSRQSCAERQRRSWEAHHGRSTTKPRATGGDEDDVEGHGGGTTKPRATGGDEDDVEGHGGGPPSRAPRAATRTTSKATAAGPPRPRATGGDEDDVEGHGGGTPPRPRATGGDEDDVEGHGGGTTKPRATGGDEDDVEGHSFRSSVTARGE